MLGRADAGRHDRQYAFRHLVQPCDRRQVIRRARRTRLWWRVPWALPRLERLRRPEHNLAVCVAWIAQPALRKPVKDSIDERQRRLQRGIIARVCKVIQCEQ